MEEKKEEAHMSNRGDKDISMNSWHSVSHTYAEINDTNMNMNMEHDTVPLSESWVLNPI